MNRLEAVAIITYLNRAGLVGAMEGQSAVWADALDDINAEDAQKVARHLVRTRTSAERWVTPGDIRMLVGNMLRSPTGAITARRDPDAWMQNT